MATQVNVREIILETLLLITRDGEYSHIALKNVLDKYQYLEKRERAFITRVVEGTLERQIEIDYIINQFSKVKVNKQKPVIRTILRSSVYQLKYMDHVPDSAVCNEAVKLAGKKGFVNLKGFVNGVLRNISRNLDMVSYPDPSNEIACLSVRYSLPMWMVEKWISVYGKETVEKMGKAFLEERPVTVRRNTAVVSKEEFEKDGVKIFPISAVSGKGISELLWYVNDLVKNAPDDVVEFEPEVDLDFHDNPDLPFEVSYNEEDDVYVIEGPRIERMLGYTNLESEKGFEFFQKFLKTNGILDQLEALGIGEGDTVRMYGLEFDYYK